MRVFTKNVVLKLIKVYMQTAVLKCKQVDILLPVHLKDEKATLDPSSMRKL